MTDETVTIPKDLYNKILGYMTSLESIRDHNDSPYKKALEDLIAILRRAPKNNGEYSMIIERGLNGILLQSQLVLRTDSHNPETGLAIYKLYTREEYEIITSRILPWL